MNKRQKEVLQDSLNKEKAVLDRIKKAYEEAYAEIELKIADLMMDELTQSKIYQIEYQKALKKQVSAILDNLNSKQYDSIQQYLKESYEDAFIGTMYDLQGQGIPLIFPINQEEVARAIVHDTKLKKPMYEALGYDVGKLKQVISGEIARGIAGAYTYADIARNIRNRGKVSMNKAYTIARTEGHRIRQQSIENAQWKAKEAGADIVKQWDSTLDKRTRPNHVKLDGQIRELDEPFEVNGHKAMRPGAFGLAKEDINCRCVLLQRARWAVENEESYEKWDGEKGKLVKIKADSLKDFKKAYKDEVTQLTIDDIGKFKTKKEAISYFEKNHGIKFSDSKKYPIDEELVISCAEWHNSFIERFPNFEKKNPVRIPVIKNKAPSGMKGSVGYYSYYKNSNQVVELALNAQYHGSMKAMKEYRKRTTKTRWSSTGNPNHTFIHEYGHHVANSMRQITGNTNWEHEFISECIQDFKKAVPDYQMNTYIGMGKHVSDYGATSESELFAEAFAEYFGEGENREFAQIFGDKLTKLLEGVK